MKTTWNVDGSVTLTPEIIDQLDELAILARCRKQYGDDALATLVENWLNGRDKVFAADELAVIKKAFDVSPSDVQRQVLTLLKIEGV